MLHFHDIMVHFGRAREASESGSRVRSGSESSLSFLLEKKKTFAFPCIGPQAAWESFVLVVVFFWTCLSLFVKKTDFQSGSEKCVFMLSVIQILQGSTKIMGSRKFGISGRAYGVPSKSRLLDRFGKIVFLCFKWYKSFEGAHNKLSPESWSFLGVLMAFR